MHKGVVMGQEGQKKGTKWLVKWEGYRKCALHKGKDLSMSRLDPSDRPSDPPPKRPEAESAPTKRKRGASKPTDVVYATWDDSEDDDDSNDGDDEEEGGGGKRLLQPKTEKR